jgi:cyclohexanecarboxylate-CoA ligase
MSATPSPRADTGASPGLRPDSRLTAESIRVYHSSGEWTGLSLRRLLSDAAHEVPDRVAAVSASADSEAEAAQLTYAELDAGARRFAAGLRSIGIRRGDSVAVMLPNQVEFAIAIFGIIEVGAVYTGIPVSYGEREITTILRRCRARCVVIPTRFRSVDHLGVIRRIRPALPDLHLVVVVGAAELGEGEIAADALLGADSTVGIDYHDAAEVVHVGFTSGTTGEPKGVMNTHQTLFAVLRRFVNHLGPDTFGRPMVNLVASPVGHHTGFLWGVLLTAYLRGTAVYLDRWEPARAIEIICEHEVTVMFGAPTFLQDLLLQDAPHHSLPSFRAAIVAGAPVPRGLPEAGRAAFGTWVCPAWGMTEYGIGISASTHPDPRFTTTDGQAVPGCELRIVGGAGEPVPPGTHGRLQIRGAGLFLGYLERLDAMAEAFDDDGWFDTGDTASMDGDGFVTLGGRTKDIIIRGGENIPATEVESLLFDHPDIVELAVVGVADKRLGERAVAVVVPREGALLDVEQVAAYLTERGLSKHFLPEAVVAVDALPKTASGKIRKVELRERFDSSLFSG